MNWILALAVRAEVVAVAGGPVVIVVSATLISPDPLPLGAALAVNNALTVELFFTALTMSLAVVWPALMLNRKILFVAS